MTGSYAAHQNIIQEFKLLCLTHIPQLHLFDRHVGLFYTRRNTPVHIGIPGQADLYGIINGIHLEFEMKSGNAVQSKQQKNWESFCKKNNVLYMVIKNPENDVQILKSLLSSKGL